MQKWIILLYSCARFFFQSVYLFQRQKYELVFNIYKYLIQIVVYRSIQIIIRIIVVFPNVMSTLWFNVKLKFHMYVSNPTVSYAHTLCSYITRKKGVRRLRFAFDFLSLIVTIFVLCYKRRIKVTVAHKSNRWHICVTNETKVLVSHNT